MKAVPAVQAQSQVRSQVEPDRHLLLDPRGGIALGQFLQEPLRAEEVKKVPLGELVDDLDRVKLSSPKRLQHELLVVLEDDEVVGGGFDGLLLQGASLRSLDG